MSEEQLNIKTWETVASDFFLQKRNSEEEKYIKEVLKKFEEICEENFYYDNQSIKSCFGDEKLKRSKEEESIDFQRRMLQGVFAIKDSLSDDDGDDLFATMSLLKKEYNKKIEEITKKYDPIFWISMASKSASSVSFATHVSKLTHSKIDSTSIYDQIDVINSNYVTTSSLSLRAIDGAVTGNQFAPVFQFLELECNGVKLADELANENSQALRKFSDDNYLGWNKGFLNALRSDELASHTLAKQVYFPIIKLSGSTYNYHLLSVMKSSSFAHAIFEKSAAKEFNDYQRKIRDDFEKKEKFSKIEAIYFSGKGKLGVTASNHSNASQLNGKRGGRLHLFSSAPPVWQSQLKPPVSKQSFFDTQLGYQVSKDDINYLRDFLIRFDKIELSIKHPKRKQWIDEWVGRIIDSILDYVAIIQNMEFGWTANNNIKLKREHQLFLDPYRDDELFQAERKHNAWQAVVCTDFARWLNLILVGKDKKFSPQQDHTRMWLERMESALREFDELVVIDVKVAKVRE